MEKITSVARYSKAVLEQVNVMVDINKRIREQLIRNIAESLLDKDFVSIEQKEIILRNPFEVNVEMKAECFVIKKQDLLRMIELISDIERNTKDYPYQTVPAKIKEIKDILRF